MVTIESTPEMAASVYETMARNLAVVRKRLSRPLTLADKVLLGHLDNPNDQGLEPGKSYLFLRPDRVILQDVNGAVKHGRLMAIIGPSGAGKTTLLNVLRGNITPTKGRILINGQEGHMSHYKRVVGNVPQVSE